MRCILQTIGVCTAPSSNGGGFADRVTLPGFGSRLLARRARDQFPGTTTPLSFHQSAVLAAFIHALDSFTGSRPELRALGSFGTSIQEILPPPPGGGAGSCVPAFADRRSRPELSDASVRARRAAPRVRTYVADRAHDRRRAPRGGRRGRRRADVAAPAAAGGARATDRSPARQQAFPPSDREPSAAAKTRADLARRRGGRGRVGRRRIRHLDRAGDGP